MDVSVNLKYSFYIIGIIIRVIFTVLGVKMASGYLYTDNTKAKFFQLALEPINRYILNSFVKSKYFLFEITIYLKVYHSLFDVLSLLNINIP